MSVSPELPRAVMLLAAASAGLLVLAGCAGSVEVPVPELTSVEASTEQLPATEARPGVAGGSAAAGSVSSTIVPGTTTDAEQVEAGARASGADESGDESAELETDSDDEQETDSAPEPREGRDARFGEQLLGEAVTPQRSGTDRGGQAEVVPTVAYCGTIGMHETGTTFYTDGSTGWSLRCVNQMMAAYAASPEAIVEQLPDDLGAVFEHGGIG